MRPGVLAILIAISLVATVLCSTGVKVLHHFSRRQLELFCRLRKRRALFGQILDLHAEAALAAEKLQMASIMLLSFCAAWSAATRFPGQQPTPAIAIAAASLVVLLASAIWIPWAVARHCAAPFLLKTWWLWRSVYRLLRPLMWGSTLVDAVFRRLTGQPAKMEREQEEEAFEDEIMSMVAAGQREGLLEADARDMIEGVIELGDADVADIMTPRSQVDALDVDLSWPEVLEFVVRVGRTRLPVYQRTLDNVIGVLYVKDLLPELAAGAGGIRRPLRAILRPAWRIPSTIPLDDLLQDFLENRMHLAVVVDEYDAVAGVVTIEDVLEEIVGEIEDESDREQEDDVCAVDGSKVEVLGTAHVDAINERLGLNLPESDDFDTIAGFVISRLGRLPDRGESTDYDGIRITVLETGPRTVRRVLIDTTRVPQAERSGRPTG